MKKPWIKKRPPMSMWLSGANTAAGRARSHATAEANRQKASLAKHATRLWTGTWLAAVKPKRNR